MAKSNLTFPGTLKTDDSSGIIAGIYTNFTDVSTLFYYTKKAVIFSKLQIQRKIIA